MKKSDIEHIAHLAKLRLTDQEVEQFAKDFGPILKHFQQLQELDTSEVEPLVTPTEIESVMREDVVRHISSAEDAVANAPEKLGNLFKVPPVV